MTFIMLFGLLYLLYRVVQSKEHRLRYSVFLALGILACLFVAAKFKEFILIVLVGIVLLKYREDS